MRTFAFNKLVRDRIYETMQRNRTQIKVVPLDQADHLKHLMNKLDEEVHEVKSAENVEQIIEECADVLEVIHAIVRSLGHGIDDVEKVRQQKRDEKGGFDHHVFISQVTVPNDHPMLEHYLNHPYLYPEIE